MIFLLLCNPSKKVRFLDYVHIPFGYPIVGKRPAQTSKYYKEKCSICKKECHAASCPLANRMVTLDPRPTKNVHCQTKPIELDIRTKSAAVEQCLGVYNKEKQTYER